MFSIKNGIKKPILFKSRKNVGMSKSMFNKKSKQELAEKRMSFHSPKVRGSSSMRRMSSRMSSKGISPSVDEFDKWLK